MLSWYCAGGRFGGFLVVGRYLGTYKQIDAHGHLGSDTDVGLELLVAANKHLTSLAFGPRIHPSFGTTSICD